LSVVKSAWPDTRAAFRAGEKITYSFAVTNTGNVTLSADKVDEGAFTGTGSLSPVRCPAGAASLAPGEQVTCTASYTVTQADVDAGKVTNTATASGAPPSGRRMVSAPSTLTDPGGAAHAGLSLVKTASTRLITAVGQKVTYSFAVTNTGNVIIHGVRIDEGAFSGTGSLSPVTCPAGASSLVPGGKVTCTATYTVTAADLASGMLSNTATASGLPPGSGARVSSGASTAAVKTVPHARINTGDPGNGSGPNAGEIALGAALLALAAGGAVLAGRRRRRGV
jgi:hypothetical protein